MPSGTPRAARDRQEIADLWFGGDFDRAGRVFEALPYSCIPGWDDVDQVMRTLVSGRTEAYGATLVSIGSYVVEAASGVRVLPTRGGDPLAVNEWVAHLACDADLRRRVPEYAQIAQM